MPGKFLVYFRSQYTNQSWLAALTAILDACALVMAGVNNGPTRQAQLTFTMARCAVVDLAQYFTPSPQVLASDRLPPSSLAVLRNMLAEGGVSLQEDAATEQKLRELRRMYEPYVQALSGYLLIPLPPWFQLNVMPDSWQISSWEKLIPEIAAQTHYVRNLVTIYSNENNEIQHASHDTCDRFGNGNHPK